MAEEREHLRKLIELHRANLQHYEELEAKYGLDCPVYVKHAKEEARKGLAEARVGLAALEGSAPGTEPSIPAIPQNLSSWGEFIGRREKLRVIRATSGFRIRGEYNGWGELSGRGKARSRKRGKTESAEGNSA